MMIIAILEDKDMRQRMAAKKLVITVFCFPARGRVNKKELLYKQILECFHLSAISKCSFPIIMGFSTGSLHGGTGMGVVI